MPKLGHNIKQIKEYSYNAGLKFGEFTVKELVEVTILKFYPSGYLKEFIRYNEKGDGQPFKYLESQHITGYADRVTLSELLVGDDITSYESDEKGNWIMVTYERAAINGVCDEFYGKNTREIEYY